MSRTKNRFLGEMHEIMSDLHDAGLVDKVTMRRFDATCRVPGVPEYSGEHIRTLREKFHLSQAVLASILNASTVTIQKWEQGVKRPTGTAMKLLSILERKGLEALL